MKKVRRYDTHLYKKYEILQPDQFMRLKKFDFIPQTHNFTGPPRYHQGIGEGAVMLEEGAVLANLACKYGGPVLETGTNLAISTRYISEGLDIYAQSTASDIGNYVHTIDIDQWWEYNEEWPRIIPFNMDSRFFKVSWYKWAFIDGGHYYPQVAADIELVKKCKCERILFHDAEPGNQRLGKEFPPGMGADVVQAVNDLLDTDEWSLTIVDTPAGLIYAEKKDAAKKPQ